MIEVIILPVLKDNYTYILRHNNDCVVIDPGEAAPVISFLDSNRLSPSIVLNTHHHSDHIGGNHEIKLRYGAMIFAPKKEAEKIGHIDSALLAYSSIEILGEEMTCLPAEGHTAGGLTYYFPESKLLFTGDILFSMGCGRLFEGTAEDLFQSLSEISKLPDDVNVYCGHEYTLANGAFARDQAPDNSDIIERLIQAKALRDKNLPTLPVSLGIEKKTNLFLQAVNVDGLAKLRVLRNQY